MRTPRIKAGENGVYHCTSRIIESKFYLAADKAKEKFTELIYAHAKFTGMKIINLQIMDNHIHALLREPPRQNLSDEELLTRIRDFRGDQEADLVSQQLEIFAKRGDEASLKQACDLRRKYLSRMYDLSRFMQEVMSNFSRWLNHRLNRRGPVWEDRFKSTIVEPGSYALFSVSAYTDLNKIRAGMISDPKMDRWSGYGRAVRGCDLARKGIVEAMSFWPTPEGKDVLEEYRMMMFVRGVATHQGQTDGKGRPAFDREKVEKMLKQGGRLSFQDRIRFNWKGLMGAGILGGQDFLRKIYEANADKLGNKRVNIGHYLLEDEDSLMALRGKTELI